MQSTLRSRVSARSCRPSCRAPRRKLVVSNVAPSSNDGYQYQFNLPMWSKVESKEQFFAVIQASVAAGKFPAHLVPLWEDFYDNYNKAVVTSGVPGADEKLAAKVQATIADCVFNQFINPYTFPSYHQRLLEPYNYFEFGQRYVGTLVDFNNSVVGHLERWNEIEKQLEAKENVVLVANHQTEADPGVFAHMLMSTNPKLATDVIYIAGDRVVTDDLCKPFSMGRNLFCVHSKRHMDDDPATKEQKMATNRKTLVAMAKALNEGGKLIWVAPAGGRDRAKDGIYRPAAFDPTAVELFRNLLARAKQPGHLYPMAMVSWGVMPPPQTVEKSLGERRLTNHTAVGISVAPELKLEEIVLESASKEEQQLALSNKAWEEVTAEYIKLDEAINDPAKRGGVYSQPWLKVPVTA